MSKPTHPKIIAGQEFFVAYPFVQETIRLPSDDPESHGSYETLSWRPGVRFEMIAPDDSAAFADSMGTQCLTVISCHKPGNFPERIFYTRRWRGPDGRAFGKSKLHITTTQAFRRLAKGYRHEYLMAAPRAA